MKPKTYDVVVPATVDPFKVVSILARRKDVIYAVPELVGLGQQRWTPDDAKFSEQWHHKTNRMNCERGWDKSRGAGVRLAVIDWGFGVGGEIEDAVDLVGTFRADGSFSSDIDNLPVDDHGTWCVNLAAGRANNDFAGCGLANQSSLVLISTNPGGFGSPQEFARAIEFAVDPSSQDSRFSKSDGADVISCSITPPQPNNEHPVIVDALEYAAEKGRGNKGSPFFYAVANRNTSIGNDPIAKRDDVIAVGRATVNDKRFQCAFGKQLNFLAPGRNVKAGRGRNSLKTVSGTSFATPLAAALACLMISNSPSLTRNDVLKKIQDTCDKIGGVTYTNGFNRRYGHGRPNVFEALS